MERTQQNVSGDSNLQNTSEFDFNVHGEPVMKNALDVLEKLGKKNKVILRAKGSSIPNAVAIANIITEKMLKDISKVEKITLDSDNLTEMGRMLSTIEIVLVKNS